MPKLVGLATALLLNYWISFGFSAEISGMANIAGKQMVTAVIRVEPGFSTESQLDKVFYLDYQNQMLYCQDISIGTCRQFPLVKPPVDGKQRETMDQAVLRHRSRLMGGIEVLDPQSKERKALLFGAAARRLKTVAPPVLENYGIIFIPGRVKFRIMMPADPLGRAVQEIARVNETSFINNPLLRQIDVTGLIPYLGGLAVEGERDELVVSYQYELVKKGTLAKQLAEQCGTINE